MSRHVAPRATRPGGSLRSGLLAGVRAAGLGALVAGIVGLAVTSAAFGDTARLGLGTSGVGSSTPFGIVLVDSGGTAHRAPDEAPLAVAVPGADGLVPGRTVETSVTVANNHPVLAAALAATVGATPVAGGPDITPHLRITVLDADGHPVLGTGDLATGVVPGTSAPAGTLAARGSDPVADQAPWTAGADGSSRTYRVLVHYVDAPGTESLNGGRAHVTLRLVAQSTETT